MKKTATAASILTIAAMMATGAGAAEGVAPARVASLDSNSYLDERAEVFTRFWYDRGRNHIHRWSPAGQFERDARLLELCAAVAAATK